MADSPNRWQYLAAGLIVLAPIVFHLASTTTPFPVPAVASSSAVPVDTTHSGPGNSGPRTTATTTQPATTQSSPSSAPSPSAPLTSTSPAAQVAPSIVPIPTPTPGRTPRLQLPAVDRTNVDSVATGFVTRLFSYDATTDTSPQTAALRAAPLASGAARASLLQPNSGRGSAAEWTALALEHGFTTAQVTLERDGSPDGTATEQTLVAGVHVAAHGDHGDRPDAFVPTTVYLTATNGPDGWSITDMQFRIS